VETFTTGQNIFTRIKESRIQAVRENKIDSVDIVKVGARCPQLAPGISSNGLLLACRITKSQSSLPLSRR
jgi:hypothetical protein